jgi:hypothetical protein
VRSWSTILLRVTVKHRKFRMAQHLAVPAVVAEGDR